MSVEALKAELQALEQKAEPVATGESLPQGAPTPDFDDFCLWHTWRYSKNRGQNTFDKWKDTEGVKLTREHDQKLLKQIAERKVKTTLTGEVDTFTNDLCIRYYEGLLSWNYAVGPQWRNRDISFIKLDL